MNAKLKSIWAVIKDALAGFSEDKVLTLGASLAYATIFSIAPLLIIAIAISSKVYEPVASTNYIYAQLAGLIGDKGAATIQDMVQSASNAPTAGTISTVVSVVVLLIGATGVFGQLQDSLNTIWRVQPIPGRSVATILHQRLLSLSMVMVFAFLLLVSLLVSAMLNAASKYFYGDVAANAPYWEAVNSVISFGVVTLLFAAIFKVLPDVHLSWSDVWRGAVITALLFTIGKFLIGLYIGRSSVASSYGAAGSLIAVLVWVYYSSAILLLGAEITRAYVRQAGHELVPKPHAEFRPELDAGKEQKAPIDSNVKQNATRAQAAHSS